MNNNSPNVLFITVDHWFSSLLGSAGHPEVRTPTLDALARNGVRYTHAYSECPVCMPARRCMMTGLSPRGHGDRVMKGTLTMPEVPTLAETFSKAGYQTFGVGKTHVYPQRDRIGFDDVILCEEGRLQHGCLDDYELYLGDIGYAGQQFSHGLANNDYRVRPWPLPDQTHVTEWLTREMVRTIQRRDPTRPAFWYLSHVHPHPPLSPLANFLAEYEQMEIAPPVGGEWSGREELPWPLEYRRIQFEDLSRNPGAVRRARQAFYALASHIDNQIACVLGTLREAGLLNDTIVLFTSDHGEMLGDHGLWGKRIFLDRAARIPMILCGPAGENRTPEHTTDDRLVGLQDVMPTLLDLCGVAAPPGLEGISMVGEQRRSRFYGECSEGTHSNRMMHDGRFKLIYYPIGNRRQLFDVADDPEERNDLSESEAHSGKLEELTGWLMEELYGEDLEWVRDGSLVGAPETPPCEPNFRGYQGQRGGHWPPPGMTGAS